MLGHQGQGSVGCWGCRARAGLKVVGDEERTVEVEVRGWAGELLWDLR
jgi:hypothetical protein